MEEFINDTSGPGWGSSLMMSLWVWKEESINDGFCGPTWRSGVTCFPHLILPSAFFKVPISSLHLLPSYRILTEHRKEVQKCDIY